MPNGRRVMIDLQNTEPAIDYIRTWLVEHPSIFRNVMADRSPEGIANRIEVLNPEQPFGPPTTVVPSDVPAMYGQRKGRYCAAIDERFDGGVASKNPITIGLLSDGDTAHSQSGDVKEKKRWRTKPLRRPTKRRMLFGNESTWRSPARRRAPRCCSTR